MGTGSKALANRILRGLLIGAVLGVIVLFVGERQPVVLDGARQAFHRDDNTHARWFSRQ